MRILFWFRKSTPGFGTIFMRITIDDTRSEYSTGITVRHEIWEFREQLFYGCSQYEKDEKRLNDLKKRAEEILELLYRAKKPQTASIIRQALSETENIPFGTDLFFDDIQRVFTERKLNFTLLQAYDFFTSNFKLGHARRKQFFTFKQNLILYLKSIKAENIEADAFTAEHGYEMFNQLSANRTERYSANTVYGIRQVLDFCVKMRKIKANPMATFAVKTTVEEDNTSVAVGQMQNLRDLAKSKKLADELQKALDLFLFMCLTSMHYSDAVSLTHEHIFVIDSEVYIIKKRVKNKFKYTQKIHPVAAQIISKYGQPEKLPKFKNVNEFNRRLKRVCKIAGITENITSKAGRKTYVRFAYDIWNHDEVSIYLAMGLAGAQHIRKYNTATIDRIKKMVNWDKFGK